MVLGLVLLGLEETNVDEDSLFAEVARVGK
jgi:hypothetical protein